MADRDRRQHDHPLPGVTTTKPGSATQTIPGVFAEVVDDQGNTVEEGGGYLTLTRPWPGMLRGIWGDPERYKDTYWSEYEGRCSRATDAGSMPTVTCGCSVASTTS